jgi:hypothetical protein
MVDQFTKWMEVLPLATQTAEATAKAAIDGFFSRFGYPFEIFTDQGRNFESELFKNLCRELNIHKARTTPYRPSGNGQVERYNRTLMDALRCYIDSSPETWDLHLPPIAGALRASVNRQTGYTANKLMLGREVNIPATILYGKKPSEGMNDRDPDFSDKYVMNLLSRMSEFHEIARNKLGEAQKVMRRDYDTRTKASIFKVGELVHFKNPKVAGPGKKLRPPWDGPGVITKIVAPWLIEVRLSPREGDTKVFHHEKVKPCRDRVVPPWATRLGEALTRGDPPPVSNPPPEARVEAQRVNKRSGKHYCTCKTPWKGEFMVGCDSCRGWFHPGCIGTTQEECERTRRFKCPECVPT